MPVVPRSAARGPAPVNATTGDAVPTGCHPGPVRRLLPVVLALLLTGACTTAVPGTAVPGSVEQRGPVGPVPAGLDRFHAQPLTWRDCRPFGTNDVARGVFGKRTLQCATLTVPLDYAKPQARTVELGVLRRQAAKPDQRIGALVVNPGGPGASGMEAAAGLGARNKGTEVTDRFDLVGFDPRGVGFSGPDVVCLTAAETDALRSAPPVTDVAGYEAQSRDYAAKCAERSGGAEVLGNIGTREVARDLDVLRSALGEPKLTYVGYSYGTRLGTAYAEAFPGNVRAMVLDGAVDPERGVVDQVIGQYHGFDQALDAFLIWCRGTGTCTVRDRKTLMALIGRVHASPVAVGDRRITGLDATRAITASLYSPLTWQPLSDAIDALDAGDGTALLEMADSSYGRQPDGGYSGATDALIAVRCADDERVTDRAALLPAVEGTRGTFLAAAQPVLPALDPCAFWPAPATATPHKPRVDGIPPLLVISTSGDPATPYLAGVNLAEDLKATLLTFSATQHTVFLQGNTCVDTIGAAYLVNGTLPAPGTTCTP
ncbi:alpha/beta hydrolase [Actinokineospora spheciospongiae]|nr:alpha/beta hydrolase [Actinokineospora spheciospongiae]